MTFPCPAFSPTHSAIDTDVLCEGGANTNDGVCYAFFVLRNVDAATPEDATATTAQGSSSVPNNPAITTATNNAWVVALAAYRGNDGVVTAPAGYGNKVNVVEAADTTDYATFGATKEITSAGSEDPAAWSGTDAGLPNWVAITAAFKPAAGQTISLVGSGQNTAINGDDVTLSLPAMQSGDLVVVWGGHQAAGTGIGPITSGYSVIATIAHSSNNVRMGAWYKRM